MSKASELLQVINGRANLLGAKNNLALSMPTQNDFDAKLYGDMAGGITPQGKGGNLAKGIIEGFSDVKGRAATEEKNAVMKKSLEAMQKLESLYQDTSEKLQKAQNEELAMEAMLPALNGAVQAMPKLDAVGRKELISNILEQWNVKTGNSITLVSQDATDPMLVTLKDNKTGQTTTNSLAALFPGSPGMAENMAQMQPAMVEKRQMERDYLSIAQQAEGRHQQEFQLKKNEAANELPLAEKKRQETLAAENAKLDAKYTDEAIGKAQKASELMSTVNDLKAMIKGGKVQLGPEAITTFLRNNPFINKVEGNTQNQKYSAMVKGLIKAFSDIGVNVRNQKEFEEGILSQLPTIEKTPHSANAILDNLKTRLDAIINDGRGIKEAIKGNNGMIPSDIRYRRDLGAQQPKPLPGPDGKFEGVMPDGTRVKVPAQSFDEAIKKGFKPNGQ